MHAFSKINLTMDVTGRREDGYHEVCSVMQSLMLGDEVKLSGSFSGGVRFKSKSRYLPSDGRNNAVKAAELYIAAAAERGVKVGRDLLIRCDKRIPICGGLGGSSADAAAVLQLLNGRYEAFTESELSELAAKLGADMPFMMRGGTAIASGIGELLEPLPSLPDCDILIVKPAFSGVTTEMYAAIDRVKLSVRPDTKGLVEAIRSGDLRGVAMRVYNVFEEALPAPHLRMVVSAKRKLLDAGALGASMSGTGAAVFGLFDSREVAKEAFLSLRERKVECYLTRPSRA